MNFVGWLLSSMLLLVGGQAWGQGATCIPKAEMAEIARSFTQFSDLARQDYCLDGSKESRLIEGIQFMRKTRFASNMDKSGDELFSGRFASDWWQYFIGRINEFSIETECEKGVIAFVFMFGNTMYVCPLALTPNFTSLDLASVFMHEARHIDGFPHITCSQGARQGLRGACDQHIHDGGSYAVTVETYAQIAKYAVDVHPALKAYARSSSVVYGDEAFETPVHIEREVQFLVMLKNGEFHRMRVNGTQTQMEPVCHAPTLGRLVLRGQHMILFPDDKNLPAKFVFLNDVGEIRQEAGDIPIEYNSQTPVQRLDWVDVQISTQWTAKIFKDKIVFACDPRANSTATVALNGVVPLSIVYPNGYSRAASSAHLMTETGKVLEFGCNGTSAFVRDSAMSFDRPLLRVHRAGLDVVGLGLDGKLYRVDGTRTTELVIGFNGAVHELAPNQRFSFFD